MKFYHLIILFFIFGCSFDNKTGIWKNENILSKKNDPFEDFVEINVSTNNFKIKSSNLKSSPTYPLFSFLGSVQIQKFCIPDATFVPIVTESPLPNE